jgi:hypothetical protein
MRLSREKLIHLSHVIVSGLESDPGVKFLRDRNDVRLVILDVLNDAMRLEDEIDQAARRKITSQKREIPEGSREWDILYRKYYEEEAAKHRRLR